MSQRINKDREFRRGRWSDYLKRTIVHYVRYEGGWNKTRYQAAPLGASDAEWQAYRKWKYELIDYIKQKRKDCR